MDLIGRTIKDFRGQGRGELPLPKRRRMPGDDGGSTRNLTAWALVTTQADADYGSIGKAVLEDEDGVVVDADGEPLILDDADPDYDAEKAEAVEIEFKAVDFCDIPVGWRVQLSAKEPIKPGSTWDENKVRGAGVLPPCTSKTFLTSVSCDEGDVVGEDDDINALECVAERPFPALPDEE